MLVVLLLHVFTIFVQLLTFSLLSMIYNNIHESCIFILTYISIVAPIIAKLHVAYTQSNVHKGKDQRFSKKKSTAKLSTAAYLHFALLL